MNEQEQLQNKENGFISLKKVIVIAVIVLVLFALAIVAVVLSQMLGLIGLVFSVLASNTLHSGDYEGARRLAHIGKVWSWTAIILSAIGLFLGILILPGIIQLVFYDQQPEPSGGILSHFLELILPGLRELLS